MSELKSPEMQRTCSKCGTPILRLDTTERTSMLIWHEDEGTCIARLKLANDSQAAKIAELERERALGVAALDALRQPPPPEARLQDAERLIDATARHLESNWRAIDGFFLFKLLEFLGKPADYALGGPPSTPQATEANPLEVHLVSILSWADTLACIAGWRRDNAASFWRSFDAAHKAIDDQQHAPEPSGDSHA